MKMSSLITFVASPTIAAAVLISCAE